MTDRRPYRIVRPDRPEPLQKGVITQVHPDSMGWKNRELLEERIAAHTARVQAELTRLRAIGAA